MQQKKEGSWPARSLVYVTLLSFLVQAALLGLFPHQAPCHWTMEGTVNGYMNKYLYLLLYCLPGALLWLLGRRPRNPALEGFYQSPLGRGIRTLVWLLGLLATWIPAYAIVLVPPLAGEQGQGPWITAMVWGVEAAAEGAVILVVLACGASWIRGKVRR